MTVEIDRARGSVDDRAGAFASAGPAIDRILGILAATLLFGMATMTTADVVGRRFFDLPFPGSYELTSLMLAAVIFVGLPLATERDEHVVVDLLDHLLPAFVIRAMSKTMDLLSAGVLAVLGWQLGVRGVRLIDEGAHTDRLHIPLWPVAFLAAACAVFAAFVLIARVLVPALGRRP